MMMKGSVLGVLGLAAGFCLVSFAETPAQQAELPREVSEWLARDQVQRWAAMIAEGDSIFNS